MIYLEQVVIALTDTRVEFVTIRRRRNPFSFLRLYDERYRRLLFENDRKHETDGDGFSAFQTQISRLC